LAAVRTSLFGGRHLDFIAIAPKQETSLVSTSSNRSFVDSTKFLERGRDGSRPRHRAKFFGIGPSSTEGCS
jgi:hypothetical protein